MTFFTASTPVFSLVGVQVCEVSSMIPRALSQPVLNQDCLLLERKIFPSDSPALIVRTQDSVMCFTVASRAHRFLIVSEKSLLRSQGASFGLRLRRDGCMALRRWLFAHCFRSVLEFICFLGDIISCCWVGSINRLAYVIGFVL